MAKPVSRIKKELELSGRDPGPGVTFWAEDESLSRLSAQITGPEESPFEGGLYSLSINIPQRC